MAKNICDTCCFNHLCACPGGCDNYAPICEDIENMLNEDVDIENRNEYWSAWITYVSED